MKLLKLIFCGLLAALFGCTHAKTGGDPPKTLAALPKGYLPQNLFEARTEAFKREELLCLASLQGLLAKQAGANLYFDSGNDGYRIWREVLREDYGVESAGEMDFKELLGHFRTAYRGYILCDADNPDSREVATYWASRERGIILDSSLVPVADSLGIRKLRDCREGDPFVLEVPEGGLLFEQKPGIPWKLRDYMILADGWSFPASNDADIDERLAAKAKTSSTLLGWGADSEGGEIEFVSRNSRLGLGLVPSDHAQNLSVLSGMTGPAESIRQAPLPESNASGENVHTTTFLFSDGDNLSWLLYDFPVSERWFGDIGRKELPLGWGIAPALGHLAPGILNWFYQQSMDDLGFAANRFVVGPSGGAYFYPSLAPRQRLEAHLKKLNADMGTFDLSLVQVIDVDSLDNRTLWESYLSQPNIDGIIYLDYHGYDKARGRINWAAGKPVISVRQVFWGDTPASNGEKVRKVLIEGSRDPKQPEAYSIILVHAWTHTVADVLELAESLPPEVEIVAPEELFARVKRHLHP